MEVIVQKIRKQENDILNQAIKYYSIICLVNNIKLSRREVELLAFTAINGTISSKGIKERFCREFDSSIASINNMIPKLSSLGLIEKREGEYRINKKIDIDFANRDVTLEIKLVKKEQEQTNESGVK